MSTIITVIDQNCNKNDYKLQKINKTKRANFMMAGNGTTNRYNIKFISLIDVMYKATAASRFLIATLSKELHYNCEDNVVRVDMKDLTKSEAVVWHRGFKELKEGGLVVRTKRSHYLLNPNLIIPRDYSLGVEAWNKAATTEFQIPGS